MNKLKESQMVDGYLTGRQTKVYDMPEWLSEKPVAWKHGWLNGRDDAFHSPRAYASVLRARADMILNS